MARRELLFFEMWGKIRHSRTPQDVSLVHNYYSGSYQRCQVLRAPFLVSWLSFLWRTDKKANDWKQYPSIGR